MWTQWRHSRAPRTSEKGRHDSDDLRCFLARLISYSKQDVPHYFRWPWLSALLTHWHPLGLTALRPYGLAASLRSPLPTAPCAGPRAKKMALPGLLGRSGSLLGPIGVLGPIGALRGPLGPPKGHYRTQGGIRLHVSTDTPIFKKQTLFFIIKHFFTSRSNKSPSQSPRFKHN